MSTSLGWLANMSIPGQVTVCIVMQYCFAGRCQYSMLRNVCRTCAACELHYPGLHHPPLNGAEVEGKLAALDMTCGPGTVTVCAPGTVHCLFWWSTVRAYVPGSVCCRLPDSGRVGPCQGLQPSNCSIGMLAGGSTSGCPVLSAALDCLLHTSCGVAPVLP